MDKHTGGTIAPYPAGIGQAPAPSGPPVRFTAAAHLRLLLRVDRTLSIRQALAAAIRPGARVLDAGCGTGLLSFLALAAGAGEVVAIDHDHVALARALARANGCTDRIRFLEGDLAALDPAGLGGPFDVLLAFVYSNHIVPDEGQSRLVTELRRRHGTASCVTVPDRVRYFAMPCEWPGQDAATELADLRHSIGEIEHRYGLNLGPLFDAVSSELAFQRARPDNSGDYAWAPGAANGGYRHRRHGGRFLGERVLAADIAYDTEVPFTGLPERVDLTIEAGGTVDAVMWVQELWFRDSLIWAAESFSPLAVPLPVAPGQRLVLPLDGRWRATNTLTALAEPA